MKNKIIKLIALITLAATMLLCLAACGGQEIAADAKGEWGKNVKWEFKQSTQTLTIEGSGDMNNATLKEVTETNVAWATIRNSVKKVVIGEEITGIGDYAFYSMPYLEEVSFASTVTKIGKCSFAFCISLKEINLPATLTEIGDSAFEGCYSIETVQLPTTLETLGERAFAFCRSINTLLIPSELTTLNKWTFKDCEGLKTVVLNESIKSIESFDKLYKSAFEGSGVTKSSAATYVSYTGETEIKIWRYIGDEIYGKDNGNPYKVDKKAFGDKYSYNAPAIDGYVLDTDKCKEKYSGTVTNFGESQEFKFYYKKAEAQKPAETTDTSKDNVKDDAAKPADTGMDSGTVIALCIFGVVIVGVIVGAVIVIRSDKKGNKSTTVRKNDKKK